MLSGSYLRVGTFKAVALDHTLRRDVANSCYRDDRLQRRIAARGLYDGSDCGARVPTISATRRDAVTELDCAVPRRERNHPPGRRMTVTAQVRGQPPHVREHFGFGDATGRRCKTVTYVCLAPKHRREVGVVNFQDLHGAVIVATVSKLLDVARRLRRNRADRVLSGLTAP